MHFPFLYPYQLAMAQAQAAAASGKSGGVAPNIAEQMQRAADLQRQYLLGELFNEILQFFSQ